MQALKVSKKALLNSLKFNKINALLISGLINSNHGKSITSNIQREFSQGQSQGVSLDKINSFDNLNMRIASANNVIDLLDVYEQNSIVFKNEHLVQCLRTISKLVKGSQSSHNEAFQQDKRYLELIQKVSENLNEFNENELMDLLFWARRFRTMRISTHFEEENLDKLCARATEFAKAKAYSFRNLIHLFYNTSFLNRGTDDIILEILKAMRNQENTLTPPMVTEILQSCARPDKFLSNKEYILVEHVIKNIHHILVDANFESKALIFKYLSTMELHLCPPRFRVPSVLYTLRSSLKDNVDSLQEADVINILEAYQDLPKEFPIDLLQELKEMVIVTLQHNSSNIKSSFLLDCFEKMTQVLRNRKFSEKNVILIYDELAKRLPEDPYLSKFRTLEKIVEVYDKTGVKHQPLIEKIYQVALAFNGTFFSGPILICFVNHQLDITSILDKYIDSEYFARLADLQALRLFIVLSGLTDPKYQPIKDELKPKFLSNSDDIFKFITLLTNSEIENEEVDQLIRTMVEGLKATKDKINDVTFYKGMFQSVISGDLRRDWQTWATENLNNLEHSQLQKLTDVIFSTQNLTQQQIQLYLYILSINKPENIPLKKLLSCLKGDNQFIHELAKSEISLDRFLGKLLVYMDANKKDIRLPQVFGVVKRVEATGVILPVTKTLVRKAYQISKEMNIKVQIATEVVVTLYLLENGALRLEDAKEFYNRAKENMNDEVLLSKYLSYILQRSPAAELESGPLFDEANEKLDLLYRQLSETSTRTVLSSLAAILAFPPQLWKSKKEYITKIMKEFIGLGNLQLYLEIVNALPSKFIRKDLDIYLPLLKEIHNHYPNFKKKLQTSDIITVLERFTDFGYRSASIYNLLLQDIARHFNNFKKEEYFDMICAFAKIGIKQTDLFDKILAKIEAYPFAFAINIKSILINLQRVGHATTQAKTSILNIFNKLSPSRVSEVLPYVCYIPILRLKKKDEEEFLEKHISAFQPKEISFSTNQLIDLYDFLRFVYSHKPHLAEKIKALISDFDKEYKNFHEDSAGRTKVKKLVGSYLKAMNIEYEDNFAIDGYKIDLYIPSKKIIVKLLIGSDTNFDKSTLSGSGVLTSRIYQKFSEYQAVYINMHEFSSISNHLKKIDYLVARGIESNNINGVYDFSSLGKIEDHPEEVDKDDRRGHVEEIPKFLDEEKVKEKVEREKDEDL